MFLTSENRSIKKDLIKDGQLLDYYSINPAKDKEGFYERPYLKEGEKLYVFADTAPGQDEAIAEVTTEKQFNSFIESVKNCSFGYDLSEPDIVFLSFYSVKVAA